MKDLTELVKSMTIDEAIAIAGDVKKLARYTPTFTDNVETKGYIDSKK